MFVEKNMMISGLPEFFEGIEKNAQLRRSQGPSTQLLPTWRFIPVSIIPMVIVGPLSRVVGPLPNGRFMAYKWGYILTTYDTWDDPPSSWEDSQILIEVEGNLQ